MFVDLVVVVASVIVLSIGSNGQVFATSAIRSASALFDPCSLSVSFLCHDPVFTFSVSLLRVVLYSLIVFTALLFTGFCFVFLCADSVPFYLP